MDGFSRRHRGRPSVRAVCAVLLALLTLGACGGGSKVPPVRSLPNYVPHGTATPGTASSGPPATAVAHGAATALQASPLPAPPLAATRVASGDARFAVDLDALQPAAAAHALQVLHVQWFIGAVRGSLEHAPGQVQVLPHDPAQVAAAARRYSGRVWSLFLEPNGVSASSPQAQPAAYAARLHAAAAALRAADPTARLLGPDVLDWETACQGCGGMVSGEAWTVAMREAYLAAYGQEPPFDIWSIHTYPLDWQHLPTVNYQEMEQQLLGLRAWLDSIPALRGKPIWDTELGVHWGYTAYQFRQVGGKATLLPAGQLRTDLVEDYLRQFLAWLTANGPRYRIERWFVWAAYNPDVPGDHAGAISLLHGTRLSIRTAETTVIAALGSLAAVYLSGSPLLSRGWFVATTLLSVVFVVAGRRLLLAMQPGLIGPWLLHGKSTLTLEEELQADLAYVRDYTLPRDLAILAGASRQLAGALRHAPRAEARAYPAPSAEPGTRPNVAEAEVQPVQR